MSSEYFSEYFSEDLRRDKAGKWLKSMLFLQYVQE